MRSGNVELITSFNGIEIGTLIKDKKGGLEFRYDEDWRNRNGSRPISLSMPLSSQVYFGDIVYNFFDNLLPDNIGIRNKIQSKFKVKSNHPFDLLAAIGKDCVGAIQLSHEKPTDVKALEYKKINSIEIESLLKNYQESPLGVSPELDDFRISLAGAQEKTALLKIGSGWAKPIGVTPTSHIIKMPIGILKHTGADLSESCENEYICLELAKAFGLKAANTEVKFFRSEKVLVVERFDRKYSSDNSWLMRLPQEDFCQAMGYSSAQKYESDGGPGIKNCIDLLSSSIEEKDQDDFFQAQIFFWLIAAIDGHAKNFSLFLEAGNRFRMTPLYDIISAYPLFEGKKLQKQKVKMAMSLKGKNTHWKWNQIQPRHFLSTAKQVKFSVKKSKVLYEELIDIHKKAIEIVENKVTTIIPEQVADAIFKGLKHQAKKRLGQIIN